MVINRKWTAGLIVALIFAALLVRFLDREPKRHYCDFQVYHHTALKFLAHQDIYFRDTQAVTPFKYSPFFAFCFAPIGVLPIKAAATLFFTLNIILTIILFRLACEVTGSRRHWFLFVLGALFLSRFVFLVWDSGQVTILMGVLILAGLISLSKGKNASAGALLAASILIKYTPALFLPYLIIRKQFKAVGWTMVFIVIWLMVPALVVGIHKEFEYLSAWIPSIMGTSLDTWSYIVPKNQSLISMAIRLFSESGFAINVTHLTFEQGKNLGYAFAAFLYTLALIPPFGRPRDQRIDYALLFSFLPLFNPNGWELNFVALAVPYMLLIGYLFETRWKDYFVVACVIAGFLVTSLLARDIVGNNLQNLGQLYCDVTIGTLLLVSALLKLKFVSSLK